MHKEYGFSLLEMLVALVLLTAVGGAVYSLLNNQFTQLRHFQSIEQEQERQQRLLAWVKDLNPLQQPQGEVVLGSQYQIRWQSHLITPAQERVSALAITADDSIPIPLFETQLYRVETELIEKGKVVLRHTFVQCGEQPIAKGKAIKPL